MFKDFAFRQSKSSKNSKLPNVTFDDIKSGDGKLNKPIFKLKTTNKGILFKPNFILFGKLRPYLDNRLLPNFSGIAVGDFWVFKSEGSPYFLFSLIQTQKFHYISNLSSGSKMPRSDWNLVSKYKFKIPKKDEQFEIGKLFNLIDNLVTLQQRKLEDLINIRKGLLNHIFNKKNRNKWEKIKLNKVLSIPQEHPKNVNDISEILSVKLNTEGISKGANRSTLKLGSTKYFVRHAGQLIFGKQNFFNGSIAIIPKEFDGMVSSSDVPSLNINYKIINPFFLWLYLSRKDFYKKTERWATGTGSKRLHVKTLLNFEILVPSKNEQLKIENLFKNFDKEQDSQEKIVKNLQDMKKFLLQNMFI